MPKPDETKVGIIGAGPAGLLLSHLLHRQGIESVVLEQRSREYVEKRVRAGVLEQGSADLLMAAGVGDRMRREGLVHEGIKLRFAGEEHRIDFRHLTGRGITVYGQQEVVKDLIAQRLADGGEIWFEAEATAIEDLDGDHPSIRYSRDDETHVLRCDLVAGCDGSHGIAHRALKSPPPPSGEPKTSGSRDFPRGQPKTSGSRDFARGQPKTSGSRDFPRGQPKTSGSRDFPRGQGQGGGPIIYERHWPFAWLGILAKTPPATDELIYAYHERGFALHSMRSPAISRLYLQVDADETMDAWPEDRIWEELRLRLAEPRLQPGEIIEDGITPIRSLVTEPMQRGRLFLAGDAAHIVPPTGAKGMNLAINDVRILAEALTAWYRSRSRGLLDRYSEHCLQRVWRAEHFSAWMTGLLHRDQSRDPFEHKLRLSYLRYVTTSTAAATTLAENYVGFNFPPPPRAEGRVGAWSKTD